MARSDDEDDEEDYDDENDEEEEERMVLQQSGVNDGEVEGEDDGEGGDNSEEDEEDEDGDGDGDDGSDTSEGSDSSSEGTTDDGSPMATSPVEPDSPESIDGARSPAGSSRSKTPRVQPLPPHLVRRSILVPAFPAILRAPSIEAIVAIPLPNPIYSLATTACSSYILTGGSDGYIRAYDLWASVNGGQVMTAQQKSMVGLGEGVNKAGVVRGWWSVEVENIGGGGRRKEGVYSMACESDGLWSLAGTQSGPINLYTLRHSPGHQVHSLKGHTNVVSCMTLLPGEKSFLSGSWDGTLREWDLNTGSTVRTYPTHGAQLSSMSLRPFSGPPTPAPSPRTNGHRLPEETKLNVQVNVGPDFFQPRSVTTPTEVVPAPMPAAIPPIDGDVDMAPPSPYDPLFDDDGEADADGETIPASTIANTPKFNDMPTIPPQATPNIPNSNPPQQTPANLPSFSTPPTGPPRHAAATIPVLSPVDWKGFSDDVLLTSSMDGQVTLIDRRVARGEGGVGRLLPGEKAPPWCMSACWSGDGNQVLAGRRNGTVDIWDVRRFSTTPSIPSQPNLLRTLRTPLESGPISCIVALPDGKHVATASQDNLRLWNTAEYFDVTESIVGASKKKSGMPAFKIVAGHHGGCVSSMTVDSTGRFLITASGDRGWQGENTKVVLIHEIKW